MQRSLFFAGTVFAVVMAAAAHAARPQCGDVIGGDVIAEPKEKQLYELSEAEVGDYLVIECAGAYGFVMGSNYNSKPLAAEVLIEDGEAQLVRRRQTFEDLVAGETIPRH